MGGSLSFGSWLSQRRKSMGLSQAKLALRANCAYETIRKIEAGERRPSVDLTTALAKALEISAADLERFIEFARFGALAGPGSGGDVVEILPVRPRHHSPSNLPAPRTSFVGRNSEIEWVVALLSRPEVRLVTLLGAPGIGKTRLSLQVAAHLRDHFTDGVFFVNLSALKDAALVAPAIAQTLDLKEASGQTLVQLLQEYLREKRLLLVLDNFEHLMPAAALVGSLIEACPNLQCLVTSRTALSVYGEHQFPLPPLSLPDRTAEIPLAKLAEYEAIALFTQRAQAIKPLFALNAKTAPVVTAICRQVDGLPLAIELAAARIKVLSPQELLERLTHRLKLLSAGSADLPPRQRSLRAAIAWSYDLLPPAEQALFRRLAVFARGAELAAIEAICTLAQESSPDILDTMTVLMDQSLIEINETAESPARFWMLSTIREYAQEQLIAAEEAAIIHEQHAAYYLALAEAAEPHLCSARRESWLVRLEQNHDNLRAALTWCLTDGHQPEWGLRLAGALHWFWYFRGYLSEGRAWLAQALAATPSDANVAQAKAMTAAGHLALLQDDYAAMQALLEESVLLWRALNNQQGLAYALAFFGLARVYQHRAAGADGQGLLDEAIAIFYAIRDQWGLAYTLNSCGDAAYLLGSPEEQVARYKEESLSLYQLLGDTWGIAYQLSELGHSGVRQGDYAMAQARLQQALKMEELIKDRWIIAHAIRSLGDVAWRTGDHAWASGLYKESLALYRELGDKGRASNALRSLGHIAADQGDYDMAAAYYTQSLVLVYELGHKPNIALCLAALAGVAAAQGQPLRAALLFGAADALRATSHGLIPPADQFAYERNLAQAQQGVSAETFAAARAQGQTLPLEQALVYAHGTESTFQL